MNIPKESRDRKVEKTDNTVSEDNKITQTQKALGNTDKKRSLKGIKKALDMKVSEEDWYKDE